MYNAQQQDQLYCGPLYAGPMYVPTFNSHDYYPWHAYEGYPYQHGSDFNTPNASCDDNVLSVINSTSLSTDWIIVTPITPDQGTVLEEVQHQTQSRTYSSNGGGYDELGKHRQSQCSTDNNISNAVSNDDMIKDSTSTPTMPFKCPPCGRGFKTEGYLKQHNKARHNNLNHKCGKCGKRFRTEEELEVHFSRRGGEKPNSCDLCNKSFHYMHDLRRHFRLHTQNLFYCPTCGKGFTRMSTQVAHERTHLRKKTGKKDVISL